jgi:hypothetical protein
MNRWDMDDYVWSKACLDNELGVVKNCTFIYNINTQCVLQVIDKENAKEGNT